MRKLARFFWIPSLLILASMSHMLPNMLRAADNDGFSFTPSSLSMDAKPKFSIDYKNTVVGYALVDITITIAGDLKNLPLSIGKYSNKLASNHTGTVEFALSVNRAKPGVYNGSIKFEGTISKGGNKRSGEVLVAIFVDGFLLSPSVINMNVKSSFLPSGRDNTWGFDIHFSNANPNNPIRVTGITIDKTSDLKKVNMSVDYLHGGAATSSTGFGVANFRFAADYAKMAGQIIKGSAKFEATVNKTKSHIEAELPITITFPSKSPQPHP